MLCLLCVGLDVKTEKISRGNWETFFYKHFLLFFFSHYLRLITIIDILDKPDLLQIICENDFQLCCPDHSLVCTSSVNKGKLQRSGMWEQVLFKVLHGSYQIVDVSLLGVFSLPIYKKLSCTKKEATLLYFHRACQKLSLLSERKKAVALVSSTLFISWVITSRGFT